jgi:hypothetical protein
MKTILRLFSFACLFAVSVFGQTANDFEGKYGSRTFYEIRPKILMSTEFDKNGQVCRVTFQPNRISEKTKTTYLGETSLELTQLKESFDEIVPLEQRKGKLKTNGGYNISGGMFWGTLNYENVSIDVDGTLQGNDMDFCKLFGNKIKDDNKLNTFFCSMSGSLEVVIINWTERDCNKS